LLMQDRFAFTAKYWGDKAVVCRSVEDRAGPIVDQEFGEFETWTQAKEFAARLNEGLEILPSEAEQIITISILRTNELLREGASPGGAGGPSRGPVVGRALHLQFMLAELELGVTFCRLVRSKPSENTNRLLRNARNALFDAMHFVRHAELAASEMETIVEKLKRLQAEFEGYPPQQEETSLAVRGGCGT
jgi:hypothetical protein